jgi:alpha-L-fucosidase
MNKENIFYFAIHLMIVFQLNAQDIRPQYNATVLERRTDPAMNKWRENRFGQFIHWGLYAIAGGEWKGEVKPMAAEWIMSNNHIPQDEYAKLIDKFNPVNFDPEKWAAMDKAMGAKYVVLTTKHHEGFCLWPSKYTDFDIASTPYKKDILQSFVQSYKKAGIDVVFYYSIIDWNHKDYRTKLSSPGDSIAFRRYIQFAKNQLEELMINYPDVKAYWFDGQWEDSYKENPQYGWEIENALRKIKPDIIINNRVRSNAAKQLDHDFANSSGRHYADYDASFERKMIEDSTGRLPTYDWECGMTIPVNTWGYHKDWTINGHLKTSLELVDMLVKCASNGGNFMINFGPKPDGTIREEELERAKAIGDWMKVNGEAIYGTEGFPYPKPAWGYYTQKKVSDRKKIIYAHVFKRPETGTIHLPFQSGKLLQAISLSSRNEKIIWSALIDGTVLLQLPKKKQSDIADVIAITIQE